MPPESNTFVLPPDHTFTPGGVLIHKASFERVSKLFNQATNRDPDKYGLYIYNDFFGYAILELVDSTLSSIHTFTIKKQWFDAWHALDALAKFSNVFSDWTQVDDGERSKLTEKTFGALLITTVRALDAAGQLNESTIPDLEVSLSDMASYGESMAGMFDCCYHKVLKGYGKKLFGTRTDEEREHMKEARKSAYEAFVKSLSAKEREEKGYTTETEDDDEDDEDDEDEDEEEDDDSPKVWYGNAKANHADLKDPSFRATAVWKEYKNYLAECPRLPQRGPPIWDLTKWTAEQKKQFSLDNDMFSSDDYF